jgi:hypothetical protein
MDKDTKELLKRTLTMTDDKQFLKFAKSYAAKDQAFAKAIIEKFLPVENTVDYEKMVKDCFLHKKKGGRRRYGSSLDWTTIRRDIKRLLKQLNYLRQQQDEVTAVEGAMLFLEELDQQFEDDCVYEDYNYSNSNFGNEEALSIVSDVMQNSKLVSHNTKLDFLQRLEALAKSDTYRTYLTCGIGKVIDTLKQQLLSPEEQLKDIDKNIKAAKYDSDQAYYVKWRVRLLHQLGRNDEAEKVIDQYLHNDDVAALKFKQLVDDSRYDEARAFCMERIGRTDNRYFIQPWYERLLELGQSMGDMEAVRDATKWLYAYGNVTEDDKKEFFRICRETFDGIDGWPAVRDKMLSEGKKGNASSSIVFQLYEEEKLYDRLYLYLQKLSDVSGYYHYGPYSNSGGERLYFFSEYAHRLTVEQRQEMVKAFAETILQDSRAARDRDRYRQIANGLHYLSKSCEEGSQKARLLASQIFRENQGKPAFREEINYYDY